METLAYIIGFFSILVFLYFMWTDTKTFNS